MKSNRTEKNWHGRAYEIAHFLSHDKSLLVHLHSYSHAGMLPVLRSHMIQQAWPEGPPERGDV